jgi:hypothetical protein
MHAGYTSLIKNTVRVGEDAEDFTLELGHRRHLSELHDVSRSRQCQHSVPCKRSRYS